MNAPPDIAILLARMREWAAYPDALLFPVQGRHGFVAIYPDEVTTRTDDQLLAFIRARCAEQQHHIK